MSVMRQVTFLLLGAGGVWNDDDGEQHARPIASHATLRVSLCHRCRHARPIASHATLRVSMCHRCRHVRPIASHATLRGWSQKGEILDMLYGKLIIAC